MKKEKMKQILKEMGLSTAEIKRVLQTFEDKKIQDVLANARTEKEAIEAIKKSFPSIDINELKRQCISMTPRAWGDHKKAPVEMTREELAHVAGGADGSWWERNWLTVLSLGVTLVSGVVGGAATLASRGAGKAASTMAVGEGESIAESSSRLSPEMQAKVNTLQHHKDFGNLKEFSIDFS